MIQISDETPKFFLQYFQTVRPLIVQYCMFISTVLDVFHLYNLPQGMLNIVLREWPRLTQHLTQNLPF